MFSLVSELSVFEELEEMGLRVVKQINMKSGLPISILRHINVILMKRKTI